MKNKAVFFDRDGIVNHRIIDGYVTSPREFVFYPEFFELFTLVKSSGYLAILITNQQGVGKGLMSEKALMAVHNYMQAELAEQTGYNFDGIFYCTDLSGTASKRRKPEPGMLLEAIEQFKISVAESFLIGDMPSDIKAGASAGVKTIYIGEEKFNEKHIKPDYTFKNLDELNSEIFL